ncbi:unnamed protein product, partial [Hapterophycus canaliculatus]
MLSRVLSVVVCLLAGAGAFMAPTVTVRSVSRPTNSLAMADVAFPGGKKTKANGGDALKTVAKKAGYKAAYGCEEGKCGTCEHKVNGKKVRLCVGKLPAGAGPFT